MVLARVVSQTELLQNIMNFMKMVENGETSIHTTVQSNSKQSTF